MKKILLSGLILGFSFVSINPLMAAAPKAARVVLDQKTQSRGYSFNLNKKFKVGTMPEAINARKKIKLILKKVNKNKVNLKKQKLVSALYSFNLLSNEENIEFNNDQAIWLSIKYKSNKKGKKVIKFYDSINDKWQKIPSNKKKGKKIVKGAVSMPYAIVGVFNNKKKSKDKKKKKKKKTENSQVGVASWYDYHGAASTKYPYGSVVKVTNLSNNKTCEVKIVDYGPFVEGRVIDLPRESFAEIADIGAGVIEVKIEPIYIP